MKQVGALNIVGEKIRRLRTELGLKQHELIAKCQLINWQLSRESLAKVESGIRRVNDAEVCLFAQVLGVKPSTLLDAELSHASSAHFIPSPGHRPQSYTSRI